MFSRLWRWALPTQTSLRSSARAVTSTRVDARTASATPTRNPGNESGFVAAPVPVVPAPEAPFLEQLAQALPLVPAVPAADEPLISHAVLEVVRYVTQKKLDPPVVPALVPRVLAIVDEPEVDIVRLTHVIQQDLAISAKLLSVANSPLFGGKAELKTVRQAIAHLGSEQVAQVAIGLACKSNLDSAKGASSPFAARWQQLFQHAMTCAFAAAALAGKQDKAAQEAAFLGGLFHDVGKAVALRAVEALTASGHLAVLSEGVLDETLQRVHAYPGDEFYDKWTLPAALMELCTRHHQLDELEQVEPTFWRVVLASSFDSLACGSPSSRREALHEAHVAADQLGLSDAALRAFYAETVAFGERTVRLFAG